MSIGKSGRIVIEIDPDLKKKLYSELSLQGLSLKEWFVESAHQYLDIKTNNIDCDSKIDNKK
ncbi:hypothetical protein BMR10_15530 [Methylococcaceae bacterium CS4]|nr:hypothetical protein BMR10_15530 [Methylococcaceae bacterium CS4]